MRAEKDHTKLDLRSLQSVVDEQPYPLLFATVSGAHLYGFPSADSDIDVRGVHVLPIEEVVGLRTGPETVNRTGEHHGAELDLVTHDVAKFFRLLLRHNGYALEQLLSPLVVAGGDMHLRLRELAPACLTRQHGQHYRGFADGQWKLFTRTGDVKPLLYTFRVLLTGIHLLRTHEVQTHLPSLLAPGVLPEAFAPPYLTALMDIKRHSEHSILPEGFIDPARLESDVQWLHAALDEAQLASTLPDEATAEPELHELLMHLRLQDVGRDLRV